MIGKLEEIRLSDIEYPIPETLPDFEEIPHWLPNIPDSYEPKRLPDPEPPKPKPEPPEEPTKEKK